MSWLIIWRSFRQTLLKNKIQLSISMVKHLARKRMKLGTFLGCSGFSPSPSSALPGVCCVRANGARDRPSDLGLLPLVHGEPKPVWFFFESCCREFFQALRGQPASCFLLNLLCAEVGSCQVLVLPGCLQTPCSAPPEPARVYWENNLGSTKEKRLFSVTLARGIFMEMMVGFLPQKEELRGPLGHLQLGLWARLLPVIFPKIVILRFALTGCLM